MEQEPVNKLPSNKEIIDELTKDLEKSCVTEEELKNENVSDEHWENICKDVKEEEQNKENSEECEVPKTEVDEDFIDEEALKTRDLSLSESEKEDLKEKAEKLKSEGNIHFKNGNFNTAVSSYTEALKLLPLEFTKERAILFANRAAAKSKFMLEKDLAIADCTKAIELDPNYVKAYHRRARLNEEADKLNEALEDFKKVLSFDPSHTEANYAIRRLPPLIEEKNERLKEEMLGKLKDFGNMILRPFGLSTDNFQLERNPDSENYTVKFKQNLN